MKNKKTISEVSYATVFIIVTVLIGLLSFNNLVDFYVNDVVDYNEWSADLGNKFETDEATTFLEKFQFINFNGAVRNVLGQREMNGITKLNNGHLISPQEKMTDEQIQAFANEVIKYAEFCKSNGKTFLFVQPILKVDEDNKQLPIGVEDYSNENIDDFLDCLREANVEVLDIRASMKNDGMDMYDYTYITDHHWTTEGCFYSFVQITEWIDNNLGIEVNPLVTDLNNYDIQRYPKWHLGSYGQRVGQYLAGADDYDLIIPNFDVSFIDSGGNEYSFYDSVVNTSVFENREVTSRYTYDFAMYPPEGVATTSSELKMLFVTDSYGNAMAPYLKLAYSDCYKKPYSEGFHSDYILETDPDIIVLMPFYINTFGSGAVFIE